MVLKGEQRIKFTHHNLRKKVTDSKSQEEPWSNMQLVMENMMELYTTTEKAMDFEEDVSKKVISGHFASAWSDEHGHAFIRVVTNHLPKLMKSFAYKIPYFNSLSTHDKNWLLSKNSDLFTNYISARYFGADSGLDQLTWIFGPKVESLSKLVFLTR